MTLIFFQNCVSPHQMPYISLLPSFREVDDVVVVVPEVEMDSRRAMGWDASGLMNTVGVDFLIAPSIEDIEKLYGKYTGKETWCVYSGINSFEAVISWFRLSLGYTVRRCVMTEPPLVYNHPLWLHAFRFALKDWRYVKYIDKVFVMGDEYVSYYRFWSKRWNVIPFMYCTAWQERKSMESNREDGILKILYVGSLSRRKNVQVLLKAVQLLSAEQQKMLEIGIVGDGEQREELVKMADAQNSFAKVVFYGIQPMEKISRFMEQYDVLCLPSLHDGWGAVVNEALTLGLYVICSNRCGAKYLIAKSGSEQCGRIFENNDAYHLSCVIGECIACRDKIHDGISQRITWAKDNISGEIVAKYFLDSLKA